MPKQEMPHMGGSTISARLSTQLIRDMRDGNFAHAVRLPSEIKLAVHYAVSRSVIRDVLAHLEREGFVTRIRGIGTWIHRDMVNMTNRLDIKFEFNELVQGRGCAPTVDQIRVYEKSADEKLAKQLKLHAGDPLIVIEKRILANTVPVIYSIDHLPLSTFAHIDYHTLDWRIPLFDLLETYCHIHVDSDIAQISATNANLQIRHLLEVSENEAVLLVDEIGYSNSNCPIFQAYGFYKNFFDFTVLRKNV